MLAARLAALAAAAHPALRTGCRAIAEGDEFALTATELATMGRAVAAVRRASGAARIVARDLLARLGGPLSAELPRAPSGAPRWPEGYAGSLAHDAVVAVAVVTPAGALHGVGVDVEPALPLEAAILPLIATRDELRQLGGDLVAARLLFCMKEAVYKATYPVDGVFLDHRDVEVCLASSTAHTHTGHTLRLYAATRPRLLALAVLDDGLGAMRCADRAGRRVTSWRSPGP